MAEVNLDRPSVLVVEDNSFIRVLLGNVIRSLGVESVLLSPSASAAIDQIHKVNNNPAAAGISVIDLAVVDVVMPEVDGHMLLRAADSKIEAVAGDYSDWALKSVKGLAKGGPLPNCLQEPANPPSCWPSSTMSPTNCAARAERLDILW